MAQASADLPDPISEADRELLVSAVSLAKRKIIAIDLAAKSLIAVLALCVLSILATVIYCNSVLKSAQSEVAQDRRDAASARADAARVRRAEWGIHLGIKAGGYYISFPPADAVGDDSTSITRVRLKARP